jgi:hypothetical protein
VETDGEKFVATEVVLGEIRGDGTDDDPLTGRLPGVHRDAAQMLGSMGEAQKMMFVVLVA